MFKFELVLGVGVFVLFILEMGEMLEVRVESVSSFLGVLESVTKCAFAVVFFEGWEFGFELVE